MKIMKTDRIMWIEYIPPPPLSAYSIALGTPSSLSTTMLPHNCHSNGEEQGTIQSKALVKSGSLAE
jgi:hypothetical protein